MTLWKRNASVVAIVTAILSAESGLVHGPFVPDGFQSVLSGELPKRSMLSWTIIGHKDD